VYADAEICRKLTQSFSAVQCSDWCSGAVVQWCSAVTSGEELLTCSVEG
jgi:hypothetical protein